MAAISNDWLAPLKPEFSKPYYAKLYKKVREEYQTRLIYPPADDIFNAFAFTPLGEVKVVILGQDPYHGDGQAHGLCFSVKPDVEIPPSLVNIYQELHDDLGCYIPNNGYLTKWAKQGVLLLNTVLTVEQGAAFAHAKHGWETFTRAALEYALACADTPVAAVLWGKPAQQYAPIFTAAAAHRPVLVLESAHPSPLSAYRGFFGSDPFGKINDFLQDNGQPEIRWQV